MNKKYRKLILPASLLLASQSYALGLGGLQINSALDEVLNGEIPFIIDSSEEIESIEVSVGSSADYEKVNLDKSYVPSNIKVSVIEKNGKKYINLSSIGPVSEPIVSLLLVVDWSNGHLLREYTLLLDPPLFNNTLTNEYSKPVQTETYVAPEPIEDRTESTSEINTQTQSNNNTYSSSTEVVVESGDTLWKIASRYNDGSSPQQMMVAIFNNNPEAFLNDDMNRLRKGAILTIPNSDQVSMISNGQAISEVKSHTRKWSITQTSEVSNNNSNTATSDYGIELVPPSDSETSEISDSSSNSSANRVNVQTIADLNRAKEELVSSNLENSELSSRVSELEKIINDQKLALSLKDTDLAQLQEQFKNNNQTESPGSETMADEMATDDVWDEAQSDSMEIADNDVGDSMDEMAESTEMQDDSLLIDNSEMSSDDSMQDESMDETMDETMDESMDDSTSDDQIVIEGVTGDENIQTAVSQPAKKKQSFMDTIMEYKFEGLIGLGVLLLGILGFVFFKRKGDDDLSESGGFLDSISSNDSETNKLDDFNSPLENGSTELDLSNLEDMDDDSADELEELESDLDSDDVNSDDEPEVVVMDDSDDDLEDDLDELEELDLDLDFDLDNENLDIEESPDSDENLDDELNVDDDSTDDTELSLDFELDDLDLDIEGESEDDLEEEFNLDLVVSSEDIEKVTEDADELDDLVFDTGERTIVDAVESFNDEDKTDENSEELEDLEFDLSDDLFDTDDLNLDDDNEIEDEETDLNEDVVTELNLEPLNEVDLNADDEDVTELDLESLSDEDLSFDFDMENSDELDLSDEAVEDTENIELDESTEEQPEELPDEELESEEDIDIGLDFDDLASDDAIDTKLDLAKAYFEMGDIDGAQQMVNEIIEEGNDEQKSKAESLKSEIESS